MTESTEDGTTPTPLDRDPERSDDDGELFDEHLEAVVGGLVAWPASQLSDGSDAGERD
jgi:hypothetical protein